MIWKFLQSVKENATLVLLYTVVILALCSSILSFKVGFSVTSLVHQSATQNLYSAFKNNTIEKSDFIERIRAISEETMDIYYLIFTANTMVVFLFIWALQILWMSKWKARGVDEKKLAFYAKYPKLSNRMGMAIVLLLTLLSVLVTYMLVSKFYLQWSLSLWQAYTVCSLSSIILFLYPIYGKSKHFTGSNLLSQNEI